MNIIEVIEKVKKEIGMSPDIKIEDSGMGRYYCTDNFTTILASKDDQDIEFWATTHKLFVDKTYKLIKDGKEDKVVLETYYAEVITDKLKKCHKKPEIDIFLTKKYGDITVVAYTDTIDIIVQENESINAVHSA